MQLQRFTTEYIDSEDRVRISGDLGHQHVVLWLTRRMIQRLVPVVVAHLDRQTPVSSHTDLLHQFSQQAACAEFSPEPPVEPAAESKQSLIAEIDLAPEGENLTLIFRQGSIHHATLTLAPVPLRQWLSILYSQTLRAEWNLDIWPSWLQEAMPSTDRPSISVLH